MSNFTDVDDKIIKKSIEEGVDADTVSKPGILPNAERIWRQ